MPDSKICPNEDVYGLKRGKRVLLFKKGTPFGFGKVGMIKIGEPFVAYYWKREEISASFVEKIKHRQERELNISQKEE